jgi:uncharacterized protein (DUF1800 family)
LIEEFRMEKAPPAEPAPVESSPSPSVARSRRDFLVAGALAAAAVAPRSLFAQGTPPSRRISVLPRKSAAPANTSLDLIPPPPEWQSVSLRLVRRVTNGITPADVAAVQGMGYQEYLNSQVHYDEIDDSALEADVAERWPLLSQTPAQLFAANSSTVQEQLQEAMIYRSAFSSRQLYQRMVEFWSDHFNIYIGKVGYLKAVDDRDVIRANALGTFPELLYASSHSPGMLAYLDQNTSLATAPNQNYAREVMELHTLGVNGGYTQDDVAELSRVLTGWTITGAGEFEFNPSIHDWGEKTVLGVTIPASSPSVGAAGVLEGETIMTMLANHPSTQQFIATKLLMWLLTPEPTTEQVNTIADVFDATGGDIALMVRAILNDGWMAAAPAKFKRPFHFLVSTLRATNPTLATVTPMNSQLTNVGQPLFFWQTPDGYPDTVEYWSGNIVPRWAFSNVLANEKTATAIDLITTPYLSGTPDAAVDMMQTNYFGGELPVATRTALLTYLKGGTFNDTIVRETIGLALGAAEFQWY